MVCVCMLSVVEGGDDERNLRRREGNNVYAHVYIYIYIYRKRERETRVVDT